MPCGEAPFLENLCCAALGLAVAPACRQWEMGLLHNFIQYKCMAPSLQKLRKPEHPVVLLVPNEEDDIYIHAWPVRMTSEGKHALQLAEERHCAELNIPVSDHPRAPLLPALSVLCSQ